jgi:pyruvate formate lyase activating enzyme
MNLDIFDIKRFAIHDGDGIRTTIFFKGCPLRCKWCHNPEGLINTPQLAFFQHKCVDCGACIKACPNQAHKFQGIAHFFEREKCVACGKCVPVCPNKALQLYGKKMTITEITDNLLLDKAFYDTTGGGITLSGGECLIQYKACAEILKIMKMYNINTAVDTSGYVPQKAIEAVLPYTDVFLYDIKHLDSKKHKQGTGEDNDLILKNLKYISENNGKIEIRIPLIIGFNDDNIESIGQFLSDMEGVTKIKLLPYHDYAISKYRALGYEYTLDKASQDNGIKRAESILKKINLPIAVE